MGYNEQLSDRIRAALMDLPQVEEKRMFGGICYMDNNKMCIGVSNDEMMCRIGADAYEHALEKQGCREMVFTGRPMNGYVFVSNDGMKNEQEFRYWIDLCLAFNKEAKPSKKKTAASKNPR